ncbi:lactoylglutathione lyase [Spirochaetia bacterium]|nr:lactoylglutathione lyase [Spirochaetia bacterium]
MVTGIAHLAITVKDMEKSLDFYTRILGFKKAFEMPNRSTGEPWIVYLHIKKNQFLELFYHGERDNPWDASLRGFNHICLEIDDIQGMVKHIEDSGWKIDQALKQGGDKNLQAWISDPDGVRIELMQISPESPQGKIAAGLPL